MMSRVGNQYLNKLRSESAIPSKSIPGCSSQQYVHAVWSTYTPSTFYTRDWVKELFESGKEIESDSLPSGAT